MANHGDDVTMPARPGAQNAKTILGVVVGYSLDETRQYFLGRRFRLRTHAHINQMPVASGWSAASGSFLTFRTRRGSRASSFGCKKSARYALRRNFGAGERRISVHALRKSFGTLYPPSIRACARRRVRNHVTPAYPAIPHKCDSRRVTP